MPPLIERSFETLAIEQPAEHLLLVRLNRPNARNAMNTQMGRDLLDVAMSLLLDPGQARCVVLTGTGDKAFCAGGDLKERRGMTDQQWMAQHAIFEQATWNLADSPIPVIAAVNGAAFGGGCEIALTCDFIYAADTARFALTEVTLGIMPGAGGTVNMPRAAGTRRAKEILMTGKPFTAAEGYEWGIINKVVPADDLLPAVLETAQTICNNAPISVRQIKKSVDLNIASDRRTALGIEIEAYNRMVPTKDRHEGVLAFNEKRKPDFKGH